MSESGGLGPDDPDHMAPAGQGLPTTRLRCRISRRSTSVAPPHSPAIESSVSAYSRHCRRIGHVSPSSRCLPVVGSRPPNEVIRPRNPTGSEGGSPISRPIFSRQILAVGEPRKPGGAVRHLLQSRCDVVVHAEFRFADPIPQPSANPCFGDPEEGAGTLRSSPTPPPGPPPLLAHRTGTGASRSRDMFRGIAHVSL
jgi:hypothetical protein